MTGYSTGSSSANSKANNNIDDDLSSLFHLSTIDITNQLNVMLDTESKVQYQCFDYLQYGHSTYGSGGGCGSSRGHPSRSSISSASRSTLSHHQSASTNNRHTKKPSIAITKSSRSKIVTWLNNCVDYLNISRECVALSMSYVDQFMSSSLLPTLSSFENDGGREAAHVNNVKRDHIKSEHKKIILQAYNDATIYQLVSLSSLFIAIKQLSSTTTISSTSSRSSKRRDVDAVTLANLSHNNYTMKEIITMELVILDVLHWNIMDVTSYSIACYGVAILNKVLYRVNNSKKKSHSRRAKAVDRKEREEKISKQIQSVIDFTKIQIELSITSYNTSTLTTPSTVAFAAILNSIELLDSSNKQCFTSKEKDVYYDTLLELVDVDLYDRKVDKMRDVLHDLFDEQYDGVVMRHDERKKGSSSSSPDTVTAAPQDRNDKKIKRKGKKKSGASVQSISSSKSPTGVDDLHDMSKKKRSGSRSSKSASRYHGSSSSHHRHEANSNSRSYRRKNRDGHTKRRVQLEP